jgi:hypothetical protein
VGRDRLPPRSQRIQFPLHLLQARHTGFVSVTVKTIQAKLLNPVAYVAVCKPFVVFAFSAHSAVNPACPVLPLRSPIQITL